MNAARRPRGALVITLVMTPCAVVYLYPLILVVINSLKTFSEITANVVALPTRLNGENFVNAFTLMRYPNLFLNTLLVTCLGTAGVVLLASIAGFKLSRTRTRYSWLVFLLCVAPMMIPFHSFMIALVKVARTLHLTNSTWGLGIIYWGLGVPLSLFMYHGFVKTVPKELDDCAAIDGCRPLRAFFQVIFPAAAAGHRVRHRDQRDVDVERLPPAPADPERREEVHDPAARRVQLLRSVQGRMAERNGGRAPDHHAGDHLLPRPAEAHHQGHGRRRSQGLTQKGDELKFTDGYWGLREGVKLFSPVGGARRAHGSSVA